MVLSRSLMISVVICGLFLSAGVANAQTVLYVDDDAAPGGDGSSWSSAFQYLQDALGAASATGGAVTEIRVAAGTYKPEQGQNQTLGDRNATFQLLDGVALLGGYAGLGTSDPDARDIEANATILSGDLAGDDEPNFRNNDENSYHVVTSSGTGSTTVLDGVTVCRGYGDGSFPDNDGAGIYNASGSPTLANCTIIDNEAKGHGAGIYNSDSDGLTLTNCKVNDNTCRRGGGMYNYASINVTLSNCTFHSNGGSWKGAGMYNDSSSPTLSDCIISENAGGGMFNVNDSSPTLDDCTFLGNWEDSGGGMRNESNSNPILTNCKLIGNKAGSGDGGGVYSAYSSSPTLVNCLFSQNRASKRGGGIYNGDGSPILINCTFNGNSVYYTGSSNGGGGIYNGGMTNATFINCTICNNTSASVNGSGIYSNTNDSVTLVNCIVWGNNNSQVYGPATITYSCVQDGWPGEGNIDSDPKLLCAGADSLGLRRGSPCIDAGNNAAIPAGITTDFAGNPRFVDDPDTPDTGIPGDPPSAIADMGAHEYLPVPAQRLYVNANAAPGGDGLSWATAYAYLQDAILLAQSDAGIVEIWVAGGEYKPDCTADLPTGSGDRLATFYLPGGTAIYGGFPGLPGQEGDFSVRDPGLYVSLLNGDLAGDDEPDFINNDENCYHVVTSSGTGAAAILDGFTISGGNPEGHYVSSEDGGGINNLGGSPTLSNCSVIMNSGGGMRNMGGHPTLTHCTFSGNQKDGGGGGILSINGNPILINCRITENTGSSGNGIFNSAGSPILINCTVSNHFMTGLSNTDGGAATLVNCILWNNGTSIVGSADVSYSCIEGGWEGTGNISTNPRLLFTGQIRRGSPCIDAGNNAEIPAGITTDFLGNPRFVDDPDTPDTGIPGNPPTAIADIGAFEYQPVAAKRLYVNASATPGGDGQSWTTAYSFLQDAFMSTDPGVTEIWVAAGVYQPDRDTMHPSGSGDRSATFALPSGVAIHGGFPGQPGQEDDFLVRDPDVYITTLSGDLAGNDIPVSDPVDLLTQAERVDNSFHVLTAESIDLETLLDGFSIAGGHADSTKSKRYVGGGLYCYKSDLVLTHCTFSGNVANSKSSSFTCSGGALYNNRGNPNLIDCDFIHNAVSTSRGRGGAIANSRGDLTLTRCTFNGNCGRVGGAIHNGSYSSPIVTSCAFIGNTSWSNGGAMLNEGQSSPTITNCLFKANISKSGRGGVMLNDSDSCPTLTNCTLVENVGCYGAAIYQGSGTTTLVNCILWNMSGRLFNGSVNISYSCIQEYLHGVGNIPANPLFANPAMGDFRLLPGSPCIDAGNNDAVPEGITTDLDGNSRITDGDLDNIAIVDMGAYEFLPIYATLNILPGDGRNPFVPNKKSNGRLPMVILGSEELAVGDIDLDSIKIAGTISPIKTSLDKDINGDGLIDLVMHFARRELIDALSLDTYPVGAVIDITVIASREEDGYPIVATDSIEIVGPSK